MVLTNKAKIAKESVWEKTNFQAMKKVSGKKLRNFKIPSNLGTYKP
jgi:hypothetical protein